MHQPAIKISFTGSDVIIIEGRLIIKHNYFQTFSTFLTTDMKRKRTKGIHALPVAYFISLVYFTFELHAVLLSRLR